MSADPHVVEGSYTKSIYTYATLPAVAGQQGEIFWCSDLTVNPKIGVGVDAAGGGTNKGKVISNGTKYIVFG